MSEALDSRAAESPAKTSHPSHQGVEKRRLQNRESQRTFREKQRRKKQVLARESKNEISASQKPRDLLPSSSNSLASGINTHFPQLLNELPNDDTAANQILNTEADEPMPSWFLDPNLDSSNEIPTDLFDMSWQGSQSNMTMIAPASLQSTGPETSFNYDDTYLSNPTASFNDMSMQSTFVMANSQPSSYPSDMDKQMGMVEHKGTLSLLQVPDTSETRDLLENALRQNHSIGSIFLAGLRSISSVGSNVERLPDMRSNHLSLRQLSTMQAYLANARALHFDVPSLMYPFAPSPFHQAHLTTVATAQGYISALPETLPLHLRPTSAQVLHAHLPFLDLLPFPTLRERAITLASTSPPLICLAELKKDIMNDGLLCWGGTNRGGQPWDMRTWEAASWFLKKWWILVGGESDEVREGARWWRQLRGEELTPRFQEEI